MLRICGLAASFRVSAMTGYCRYTSGWSATSDIRAMAPRRKWSADSSIADHCDASGLISTIVRGRMTSSFIRSIRVVPPATAGRQPR